LILISYSHTPILSSLSLRKAISFLSVYYIQQLQGTDFKISAQANVQPNNILLIQGGSVNTFKTCIIQIHKIGIY
jgi:hypothetical protein